MNELSDVIKRKIGKEIERAEKECVFLDEEMHDYNSAIFYRGYTKGLKKALKICEEVVEDVDVGQRSDGN